MFQFSVEGETKVHHFSVGSLLLFSEAVHGWSQKSTLTPLVSQIPATTTAAIQHSKSGTREDEDEDEDDGINGEDQDDSVEDSDEDGEPKYVPF